MRLINSETNQPLVEFIENEVLFYNKFLEKEMQSLGIPIPSGLRSHFDGLDYVYLGDLLFEKAFREIYYPSLDMKQFHWVD